MGSAKAAAAAARLLLLTVASTAAAFKFNVTEIISEFPEFSTFNGLLSETKLADEINRRQAITVLVVDDSAAGAITSLPAGAQREVLAVQILLDYYDPVKLDGVRDRTALLATLFQASGAAAGLAGFVNYTQGADDQMAFGSAEPGAPLSSQLVKVVASRPYNISVMQVSAAIVPPSIGGHSSEGGTLSSAPVSVGAPDLHASAVTADADERERSAQTSSDADSDDDATAPTADADAPASSLPAESANAAVDKPTSAGSRVMAGASVGIIGLVVMLMILIWC